MSIDPLTPLMALPGVADAVRTSRAATDALLAHRVLRRRSADVSAESLLRGAWASAALAGSQASLQDFRDGNANDPIAQGALRVSVELAALANSPVTAQRQALARLHLLAAADLALAADLGRPRPDREVAHRLDLLADTLVQTSAPAAVVAAVIQAEILSLDAFAPASGVVARGAARLTLIQRGLDPKSLVALEVGHWELREEIAGLLEAYAGGSEQAVTAWILHCCRALELGARESVAVCESIQRG